MSRLPFINYFQEHANFAEAFFGPNLDFTTLEELNTLQHSEIDFEPSVVVLSGYPSATLNFFTDSSRLKSALALKIEAYLRADGISLTIVYQGDELAPMRNIYYYANPIIDGERVEGAKVKEAHHDYLVLHPDYRKKGIATIILRNYLKFYKIIGLKQITAFGAWQGKYVWGKRGFRIMKKQWERDILPIWKEFVLTKPNSEELARVESQDDFWKLGSQVLQEFINDQYYWAEEMEFEFYRLIE